MLFVDAITLYTVEIRNRQWPSDRRLCPTTLRVYSAALVRYLAWLETGAADRRTAADAVAEKGILGYYAHLQLRRSKRTRRHMSPGFVRSQFSAISSFSKWYTETKPEGNQHAN